MLYWCKISASYIILSVKEELLSVPGCGHTHTPVKTVLLKMQILLALEPLKGWVNDTCLGVNKEHCNSRLVSDLDITHFYNDSKISSLKGTHFWIFFFFLFTVPSMFVLQKIGLSFPTVYKCMCNLGSCLITFLSSVYAFQNPFFSFQLEKFNTCVNSVMELLKQTLNPFMVNAKEMSFHVNVSCKYFRNAVIWMSLNDCNANS